jgi:hypothetical protein
VKVTFNRVSATPLRRPICNLCALRALWKLPILLRGLVAREPPRRESAEQYKNTHKPLQRAKSPLAKAKGERKIPVRYQPSRT